MPWPFIDKESVVRRLGKVTVDRIYEEFWTEGEADVDAIQQLAEDASSRVMSAIRASRRYDHAIEFIKTTTPFEAIRLALDVAHFYAAKRHPEVMRQDWAELGKAIESELSKLVKGEMMLDVPLPQDEDADEDGDGIPDAYQSGLPVMDSDCARGW